MVSDGMSMGIPSMAEPFALQLRGEGTQLMSLYNKPGAARGLMETRSLSSLVTDSAAASSSWGSGSRVFNGSINTLPDGTAMTPLLKLVKDAGYGTGLVTTTSVTHATPAGFASSVPQRGMEDEIATQYLGVVDVIMGGGTRYFLPAKRKDGADLAGQYQAAGYTVWDNRKQITTASAPKRILGLFSEAHMPFSVDHMNTPELMENTPTLAEMTRSALEILERNPQGFVLQVEGGRIDHGAHANDIAAALHDQLAFDDAIAVALEFARRYPDTLVVVTSDHGNSNPGLNGMGGGYGDSTACFERIARARGSFETMGGKLYQSGAAPQALVGILNETLDLKISEEEIAPLVDMINRKPSHEINLLHRNLPGILGQIVGNHNGVGWTGTNHTQDATLVVASGPGQEAFEGFIKNTEVFTAITSLLGIDFRNPSMSEVQAHNFANAPSEREYPHWV